jgi:hypothetical protein
MFQRLKFSLAAVEYQSGQLQRKQVNNAGPDSDYVEQLTMIAVRSV